MGEFFKGWRRKAGCVTLVMALTLTAQWIGSYHADVCGRCRNFVFLGNLYNLDCINGCIDVEKVGFDSVFGHRRDEGYQPLELTTSIMRAPYWSFVIPLTLLSGFLILWPGKRKAAT